MDRIMLVVRRYLRYFFNAACVGSALLIMLYVFGLFILNPFHGFAGSSQFTNESGTSAQRMMHEWPAGVDPENVRFVSRQLNHARDSHSSWYKIELDANSAEMWADSVHANRERHSLQSLRSEDRGLEAVRRVVIAPPPLHRTTGDTPGWWKPPAIDFRATEAMKWYSGNASGVGQAAYTGYDLERQTLWVYEYACQHDRLWEPGQMPDGDVISRLKAAPGR